MLKFEDFNLYFSNSYLLSVEDIEKILCKKKDLRRLPYTLQLHPFEISEEISDKHEKEQKEKEEEEEKIIPEFKEKIRKLFNRKQILFLY